MNESPSFFIILSRTLSSKCPVCGRGRLFVPLLHVSRFSELFLPPKNCASCGFVFGRQPGYYFGVITPILPMMALVVGAVFAGIAYFGFHQELEPVLVWGGIGVGLGFFGFFRKAIALYIAFDHALDPPPRG